MSLAVGDELSMSFHETGNVLPIERIGSAPSGAPPKNKGVVFRVSAGSVTTYVWDGAVWRS